jgi:hypothetical protein
VSRAPLKINAGNLEHLFSGYLANRVDENEQVILKGSQGGPTA